jgi:NADH dehydrogenase
MAGNRKVVIVGGGFGGLYAAKALSNKPVDVTLIDKKNHHTFQPLLYQVASSVISPSQIAIPLRHILRKGRNVEVLLGEVAGIDLVGREVVLGADVRIPYDYLILAAGSRHSYFGHDEWEQDAPGLKTLEDAIDMRRRILLAFEQAERQQFLTGTHDPVNFAIVGGGPTGVELAGAVADIAKTVVAKDYKLIDTRASRVMLLEGASSILGMYPRELQQKATKQLEELGVEVRTGSLVTDVTADRIKVGDEWIPIRVTLWATGVAASPLGKQTGGEIDRAGRVKVAPDLSVPGHSEILVVGDMAALSDVHGVAVPGLASAATQMGPFAARNILREIAGQPREKFAYKDKGTMATIGKNRAIALIGKVQFSGFVAWLAWGLVHLILLIGFRNRFFVMWEWAWTYVTGQRSARLITGPVPES